MSQNQKLENHFRQYPGTWLSLPELVEVSGSYAINSRVSDLRDRGLTIQNRLETRKNPDGSTTRLSLYRYQPSQLAV